MAKRDRTMSGCRAILAASCLVAMSDGAAVRRAFAQDAGPDVNGITAPSIATSLPANGDPFGTRKDLAARGITYNLYYTNDILTNVRGGNKRGTIDQGKLEGALTIDLEKAAGLTGLTFFANGFDIHNTGRIRRDYVGGLNTIAAIEAVPAIRLSELWLERQFSLGEAKASLRVGQLAADVEFLFSGLSSVFLQSDWATITAANLPSGGPAYPLSTPGIRLKYDPAPDVTLQVAVYNGDPAGPGQGDEQLRNHYGLNFRVRDPALVMGEAQWRRNTGAKDPGLAGTIKIGAWGHFGAFDDQRLAFDRTLLADPAGPGAALRHHGDAGIYAVVEQQLYRPQGAPADGGISVFSRISSSPSDRNLIDFYIDGGIVFAGMVPRRPDDKFGASVIYAQFSESARAFDRDLASFGLAAGKPRDYEANIELNYQAQIIPGWLVQPNVQYVMHPSGMGVRLDDAVVVGVRSFVHY